tara:strand:- start:1125 stop:2027 length:903 start_codon:yes stop_codon:yes gene_type:complete
MSVRNNEERAGPVPSANSSAASAASTHQAAQNPKDIANASNLNFIIPTEFVELPSQGQFYPKGHPMHGKDTLEIKHMTAKEEDILTSRALLKKGIAIDRLLQSIIIDKTVRPHELLVGDKNAIMVSARISAYGSEYKSRITCPNCMTVNEPEIDLSACQKMKYGLSNTEEIEGVEGPSPNGTYLITLPATKAKVEVKLMNGADEKRFSDRLQYRKKNRQPDAMLTDQIKTFTVAINGTPMGPKVFGFIDNMPIRDSRFLRNTYNKLTPVVELKHNFCCDNCAYEQEVEVPITAQFFWPDS